MVDPGSSLFRRLIWRQASEGLPSDSDGGLGSAHHEVSKKETASSERENWNKAIGSEEYVGDRNSLLSLQPWIFRKDIYQEEGESVVGNSHFSDSYRYSAVNSANILEPPSSPKNFSFTYNSHRNRRALRISGRTRRTPRYSVKPLSSVENCLIPQLYGSDFETQEFVFGPAECTSSRSSRSFHITDGSRIISKSHYDLLDGQSANDLHTKGKSVCPKGGVTLKRCHPERGKTKRRSASTEIGGVSISKSGLCDKVLLFYVGIGVGVISTLTMNKKEVDQLSNLLRQSENLVQDLQEELSMKDTLTVNELVCDAQDNANFVENLSDLQAQVHSQNMEFPTLHSTKHDISIICPSNSQKDGETSESMSKIEAELEAELERLELNISASSLEGKLSVYDESYHGLLSDVVHGELREDMIKERSNGRDESHGGSGETSTGSPPANYAVSPRELTLRLHELNQSILENRIKELEARLDHSEKQLQLMEAERADSVNSSSDLASSSNLASPTMVEKGEDMTQPLCLSLCDDALDAYEEAYDEFLRMAGSEERSSPATNAIKQLNGDDVSFSNAGSLMGLSDQESYDEEFTCYEKKSPWKDAIELGTDNEEVGNGEEDLNDINDNDDDDRMLIQQIVERMRRSSSVVLNAQKLLLSLD